MLSFLRRALSSWLVLGLLGLLIVAFIVTGANAPHMPGSTGSGETLVTIGKTEVKSSEVERQIQRALTAARQQDPNASMATFLAQGGFESTLNDVIKVKATELWAMQQRITASDKLVDGQVAAMPAFRSATGKFDQKIMNAVLQQNNLTEREMRDEMRGDAVRRQLLIPVAGAARAPVGIALPYSSLMLEQRSGQVAVVPTEAVPAGAAPTDAEIQAYYRANIARFTYPERRALRYALFGTDDLTGSFAPTDADIQRFYDTNRATYAGSETRSFNQVVLRDPAAANALAAKVRGGTAFATAASQAGFGTADIALNNLSRQSLSTQTNAAVAAAAFGAAQNAIVGPIRSDFGWHVLKVVSIRTVAAKPLDSVKSEITETLTKQKRDEALASKVSAIQDAIDGGSSFDDVLRSEKMTAVMTPALMPDGSSPDDPAYHAPPEAAVLLRAAQQMGADDDPVVQTIGAAQRYALLAVARVVPAAPAPLARVRPQVVDALIASRRAKKAEEIAKAIQAKVKGGTPLAQAVAQAGIPLPPPQPVNARQLEMAQRGVRVPRPLALMFSMRQGDTKPIPAEQNAGWFVVALQRVVPGDARTMPSLVDATRSEFTQVIGSEYGEQFGNAAVKALGVKRDQAAIARLRARLAGGGQ